MAPSSIHQVSVCLLPEPPAFGSMSMRRYWMAMLDNHTRQDDFTLHSVFAGSEALTTRHRVGRWQRLAIRNVLYPFRIRAGFRGQIAHVLDHSWADMLRHVPAEAVKVATVHDLIPLRYPGELQPRQVNRFRSWVKCLKLADILIADSSYTKSEIEFFLGIPGDKIRVVPLGVDMPANQKFQSLATSLPGGANAPFRIGSIGSILQRKNLEILPVALTHLKQKTSRNISLIRAGHPLPVSLAASIRGVLGDKGLVELGLLPDEEIQGFYGQLDALVVPSHSEGFGLPVQEAMAHGTPVVCSSTTSLPEVGGNAAYYFEPHDGAELAARLHEISIPSISVGLRDLCLERARRFSWRRCLEGVYDVYRDALHTKLLTRK